ncbi:MAG: redoxin domain-containing protein [candidate division Zixibacteria bacterium]|nr:redoxin domain-containing protein [candidate division Zixibacteria bacterium]
MKQLFRWFTVLAIFLMIFALWNPGRAVEDPMTAVGAFKFNKGLAAPGFNIETLAGDPVRLEDFRGKVVLIDFWATW